MIKYVEEQVVGSEQNAQGVDKMYLNFLNKFDGFNKKVRTFASVNLLPGEEVEFHTHVGEMESYYIISGVGEYSDNGNIVPVRPGMVTFTPSGEGHGIKNTGKESLIFIALIVLD